MKEKALKEKVSVALDPDVISAIKDLAEEDDRSFSSFINKILRDYLKSAKKLQIPEKG